MDCVRNSNVNIYSRWDAAQINWVTRKDQSDNLDIIE